MPYGHRVDIVTTLREFVRHPARFVVLGFAGTIFVGTALLMLPNATQGAGSASATTALFTSTSATSVTGLAVVDTGTYWSGFGQAVILGLIEVGGLGFMTVASLITMLVSRRLGLRQQLFAQTERGTLALGDVRSVLVGLAAVTVTIQIVIAVALTLRFRLEYDYAWDTAAWHGLFHSVAAFNNAGFSLYSDSMVRFSTDISVNVALVVAIAIGGLGFPVLYDIFGSRRRLRNLTLHSKLTIATTLLLFLLGAIALTALEWHNPDTFGDASSVEKVTMGTFASVTPRTAGFNTIPVDSMEPSSLLLTTALMFIGAGSAGTSGGIKVTTFALLALVLWSEVRGESDVMAFRRRIPTSTQRQAVTVALLSVGLVVGTAALLLTANGDALQLQDAIFESASAFGTVGLSTGITPSLTLLSKLWLILVMFVGRVGPLTLGTALVLRSRYRRYRLPQEAPLIG